MTNSKSATWPHDLPRSGRDAITFATGNLDESLFREYDIRGRVHDVPPDPTFPLNEFVANRLGRAFGTYLRRHGIDKSVIGYDSRSYSESIANAVALGMLSTGVDVTMLGLSPTPVVYFAQHALGGAAGLSVTASHNPNGWAGLKLGTEPSVTLGPREVQALKEIAMARDFVSGSGKYNEFSIVEQYTDHLAKLLPATRRLRVVVDGGNGIAGPIAELAFSKAGYEVVSINRELDWSFPNHEPDPETMEARVQIQEAVRRVGADVGVSLDGDGDRLGITDDAGNIVWSDRVLALLARDVLADHPGATIVFDVKCSRAVSEVITASGGVPLMWKTGHSHIKSKMREVGAPFAGERSGHFFDGDKYYGYDDAIYSALRFLSLVGRSNQSISELVAQLPEYVATPTMQASCADAEKYDTVERFAEYVEGLGANEVIRTNGVRAEFPDGWFLVRASSNLPALVIVAEADSEAGLKRLYDLIRQGLDSDPSVDRVWMNDPWA